MMSVFQSVFFLLRVYKDRLTDEGVVQVNAILRLAGQEFLGMSERPSPLVVSAEDLSIVRLGDFYACFMNHPVTEDAGRSFYYAFLRAYIQKQVHRKVLLQTLRTVKHPALVLVCGSLIRSLEAGELSFSGDGLPQLNMEEYRKLAGIRTIPPETQRVSNDVRYAALFQSAEKQFQKYSFPEKERSVIAYKGENLPSELVREALDRMRRRGF